MKTSVNALHHQEADWLRELQFYTDELEVLRKRIEKTKGNRVSKEEETELNNFLKQFTGHLSEQLQALKKENQERYDRLNQLAKLQPESIENQFTADRDNMNGRIKDFAAQFWNTRFYLNAFLAKLK